MFSGECPFVEESEMTTRTVAEIVHATPQLDVMNSVGEIRQAMIDYQTGRFGEIAAR